MLPVHGGAANAACKLLPSACLRWCSNFFVTYKGTAAAVLLSESYLQQVWPCHMELQCAGMQAASAPYAAPAPRVAASPRMQRRKQLSRSARSGGALSDNRSASSGSCSPAYDASLGRNSRRSSRKLASAHSGADEVGWQAVGALLAAASPSTICGRRCWHSAWVNTCVL